MNLPEFLEAHMRLGSLALLGALVLTGCNEHVFQVIEPCSTRIEVEAPVPVTNQSDILIVVDNSASMCEEQANLRDNFFLDGCAIDVNNPPELTEVTDEMLAGCGFVQALYAYDLDFRLGVITTDIGQCDNRFGLADNPARACEGTEPDWGRKPQKGCLQAPEGAETKFLSRGDADIDDKFAAILAGVKTYGSAIERGLDATKAFLDADTPHEQCATDRDDFIRENAALVIIYLTDEDDCSHPATGSFGDETVFDSCNPFGDTADSTLQDNGTACYANKDELNPVAPYLEAFQDFKGGRVRVGVIAGGELIPNSNPPAYRAADCRIEQSQPDTQCTAPLGQGGPNVLTSNYSPCQGLDAEACCVADAGGRYFELASLLDDNAVRTDSICKDSYQQTMLDIARLAAIADVVTLGSTPSSPLLINVKVDDGTTETEPPRIDDDVADPEAEGLSGWQYQAQSNTVRFFGDAVPDAGQQVTVFFAAASDEECTQDNAGSL